MPAGESGFADQVEQLQLVDHHVHGAFARPIDRARFEESINEGSPDPIPAWMTQFDSQLGLAIRAWCAPILDLEPHAPADEYWARRTELGEDEVNRRMLTAAGVSDWIVDTGYHGGDILSLQELASASHARSSEIVRLEAVAESLAAQGTAAADYPDALRAEIAAAAEQAVGFKTVIAYRAGFDICWDRPSDAEVADAAASWLSDPGDTPRLTDDVLMRFGIYAAAETGLPLQLHTGFGDRDLDLHRVNPLLLLDLLRQPAMSDTAVMLLHCYPYHREAGYLAQAFTNVYCDVGLALNYVGARATAVLAESLELAPFAKVLYSSDAWGPAELHYLGARLWRRAVASTLGSWISGGDWSHADAIRITQMMASGNARRVYQLD